MLRAVWKGKVIAEADRTVTVEGNHYFPPDSQRRECPRSTRQRQTPPRLHPPPPGPAPRKDPRRTNALRSIKWPYADIAPIGKQADARRKKTDTLVAHGTAAHGTTGDDKAFAARAASRSRTAFREGAHHRTPPGSATRQSASNWLPKRGRKANQTRR
ncbi:hypothetical protein GCM10022403_038720 [Streptomyces coacervatus]|uniref:DUF427 domain-containing protein n=1 Tax=Streptomyces coacervatus TaxID=647381 RepID=A0ABP7HWY0_9ACTN|nr:DUF427 domain-containing protein [Streptomyces coacervatus]MDF2270719.1 DUF427 domain-containing protein [Streptomyces coacervatus]